jgi:hypothetical protein
MSQGWWSKLFSQKKANPPYSIIGKYKDVREGDKMILNQLAKIGARMQDPREVLHYLYLPSQDSANRSAQILQFDGYETDVRPAADAVSNPPNPWVVVAKIESVVNNETVERMRRTFEKLAIDYSGEYDGWEAAAKP